VAPKGYSPGGRSEGCAGWYSMKRERTSRGEVKTDLCNSAPGLAHYLSKLLGKQGTVEK